LGPHLAEIAERLGKPLMPHQRLIVDVAYEIDPATGEFVYSEVVVIGPRQATGKTELLLPVMAHRCLAMAERYGAQQVLYTAQTADKARDKWRDVHLPRILAAPRIRQHLIAPRGRHGGARLRLQSEAMFWRNGSQWSPGATTGKTGGTGDTLDLGVIDEAWSHPDARTELGMRPAMMTRLSAQQWVTSMIPGLSRAQPGTWKYLQNKRQVGRARVDAGVRRGMAFFDFAAPGDATTTDPLDPATWWQAMPGLGRTVAEHTIAKDFADMDLVDLCAEYLGWEPTTRTARWTLVGQDVWAGLRDSSSVIVGTSALGVEMSEDRSRGWLGAAGKRADAHWHVEVIEPGQDVPVGVSGVDWMLPRILDVCQGNAVCTVVIDPSRPARSLVVPLRRAGIDVTTPNQGDVAGACGRFFDATGQEDTDTWTRVFHLGQHEIDSGLSGARKLDRGEGAFTFVKKGSVAELGGLYSVILAMHGHELKGFESSPEPDIFF
jgi:hypothetical protein